MLSFVDALSTFACSLGEREHKPSTFPLYWTMLANGDANFHANVIFFGFNEKQNDPIWVAKVPRSIEDGWMLKSEFDHLVELWDCIGEDAAQFVPKPYALTTLQDRPVLMISYVSGESLTRLSRRTFWGNQEQVSALAKEAARSLSHLNRLTENPIERGESLDSHFQEKANKFKELFRITSEEDQVLSDLVKIVESRVATASHKVLIQGDFWHGNMIRNEERGKLMFVDWQFARWSVDVSIDVYFFLLAGALAATGDGAVEERARAAFGVLNKWRANVIPEYLSAYGKPENYALLPQKYGMLLCCVERAVRSALEFGYSHSDDFKWRCLFAELLNWPNEN